MRKADYSLLAQILRKKRDDMRRAQNGMNERQDFAAMHSEVCARDIAIDFARFASVGKAAFLKACGID
jgi:hypothetical protein